MPSIPEQNTIVEQKEELSTFRVSSSIPRSDSQETWLYPSPQMFFNAMARKGYQPSESDMPIVVPIHNMVNEQAWIQILKYEEFHKEDYKDESPKLSRFVGRPDDISPKARIRSWLGYTLPFDRHDWYVDRNGTQVRYVIDFYQGKPANNSLVSIHLDVRPAITTDGIIDRLKMSFLELKTIWNKKQA